MAPQPAPSALRGLASLAVPGVRRLGRLGARGGALMHNLAAPSSSRTSPRAAVRTAATHRSHGRCYSVMAVTIWG